MRKSDRLLGSRCVLVHCSGGPRAPGLSGCGRGNPDRRMLADKGTPYADLLVPKLTASVTDGAVGVAVDAPVTVTVQAVCSGRSR